MNDSVCNPAGLSKRAARRLIQRAIVLAGRNRTVRQHIREAHLNTLWIVEDWELRWTMVLDRGKVAFDRRPTKNPDLTLTWMTAGAFFRDLEVASRAKGWPSRAAADADVESAFQLSGELSFQRMLEPVYFAFCEAFRGLLSNPVDENGDPLI
jgi:hypothetical protein